MKNYGWNSHLFLSVGFLLLLATAANAALKDVIVGGPGKAATNLVIDGIKLGIAGTPAAAGALTNRPWVFMFADGTVDDQVFRSAVAAPGGVATNTARSGGFFGRAWSSATANGRTGVVSAAMASRGIASANALAGIGTTAVSALPFQTALTMHIATIAVDPLAFPDMPIAQLPPPNPDGFSPFDSSFVPSNATINAYLQNELGDRLSLFSLEAKLLFNPSTNDWDDLDLSVSGLGSMTSPNAITEADFNYFSDSTGAGYKLKPGGIDLTIPYSLPSPWLGIPFTATVEVGGLAASSVTAGVPEPTTVFLLVAAVVPMAGRRRVA